eukprot:jgi/Ulvmu1/6401/UM003_0029.1
MTVRRQAPSFRSIRLAYALQVLATVTVLLFQACGAAATAAGAAARRLQDTQAPVVTVVESMTELITAMEKGAAHIQLRAHLDATGFPLLPATIQNSQFKHVLPPQIGRTRSIRGNCTADTPMSFRNRISGAPFAARTAGQCIILAQQHFIAATEGKVLIENLYIRYATGGAGFGFEESTNPPVPTLFHVHGGDIYIRNVRVQGDGQAKCRGFIAYPTARVLLEDSAITHMTGAQDDQGQVVVAVAVRASPTYFLRCTFADLTTAPSSPVIVADSSAPVKIQECTFAASNTATVPLRALVAGSTFFADDDGLTVQGEDEADVAPPQPLSAARDSNFLTDADDWSVDIRELLSGPVNALALDDALATDGGIGAELAPDDNSGSPLPPGVDINIGNSYESGADPSDGDPSDGDDDGIETWVIVVIIAGVVALIAALAAYCLFRRRADARSAAAAQQKAEHAYPPHGPGYGPPYGAPYGVYGPVGYPSGHPGGYGPPPWPYPPSGGMPSVGSDLHPKLHSVPGSPGAASMQSRTSASTRHGRGSSNADALAARWHAPFSGTDVTCTDDFSLPQYTDVSPYHTVDEDSVTRGTQVSRASRASHMSRRSRTSTRTGASGGRGDPGSPVGPLPADASVPQLMDRLSRQLDGMHAVGKPVMDKYLPLGEAQRRMGGQGMVQFARDLRDDREYAIKLFVSRKAFDSETVLYGDEVLRELLPKIEVMSDNEGGQEGDAHNTPLPPFIVMEKGEALDEWSRRAKPDMFQSVAMLANISRRLADMHEAGYVHRDLKPGNVMWLPRENRWTIIDFGCVARAGKEASISYSLRYTAPEVIQALHRRERVIVPEPSLDAWSLGVMAFELLTGKPAFQPLVDGTQQILAQLLGEQDLPWEGARAAPDTMRKLRTLRAPVMSLLERNPLRRMNMQQFCESCDDIFGTRTFKPAI